ncbi:unnamed protein product, partial [Effrenium voratum]
VSLGTACTACADQWQQALHLYASAGEGTSEFLVTAAALACAKAQKWQQVLVLFEALPKESRLGVELYTAAIDAYGKRGSLWRRSMRLLGSALKAREANLATFTAAATAVAGEKRLWRQVLQLLRDVRQQSFQADAALFRLGVMACERGSQWQLSLSLFARLENLRALEPGGSGEARRPERDKVRAASREPGLGLVEVRSARIEAET